VSSGGDAISPISSKRLGFRIGERTKNLALGWIAKPPPENQEKKDWYGNYVVPIP